MKSFYDSLKEVGDIAGQHELLSESFQSSVYKDMMTLMSELKAERKRHMDDARKLEAQLQSQIKQMEQVRKRRKAERHRFLLSERGM